MIMNKPIIFFNHFHNGDLFNSKAFVSDIMEQMPLQFFYAHGKSEKILKDLDVQQLKLEQIFPLAPNDHMYRMISADNALLVNTWIGSYFEPDGECTLQFSYNMYKKIYEALNTLYGTNLQLKHDMTEYFSSVDFSSFDLEKTNNFLSSVGPGKKILYSNGPALSGQCIYNGDMKEVIERIANEHSNICFIATHKFDTDRKNIHFTQDIIGSDDCDLNEISYISNHCELIVGRSSGPFSFSCTKYNMMNSVYKTFVCFGDKITDCFQYGVDTKAKFVFEKFSTLESLYDTIKKEIND